MATVKHYLRHCFEVNKMKRFNYDENDDFQDENFYEEENEDDDVVYISQQEYDAIERQDALDLMQLELVELDLNQRLLFKTIKMLEKSWIWRFRKTNTKLKMISEAYAMMQQLTKIKKET